MSRILTVAAVAVVVGACIQARPMRNGLRDESVYLEKQPLTANNPKLTGKLDDGWLMKVMVTKASSPNVVGDYVFPGLESDTRYVRFRFQESVMQLIDARVLQHDDPNDPNDNLSTRTDRVMMEFPGTHVDVKYRENLDGERTNFLEENTEEPWERRQSFKVDFEKSNLDPVHNIAWFYGDYINDCVKTIGTNLVPGSFTFDEGDQHMQFTIEVNYALRVLTDFGPCYDMLSFATDVSTATIHYTFSFYRQGETGYRPEVIAEKDPVNKKFGVFQRLNAYRDEFTGILGAKSLIQRWNPERREPVVFYFAPGFPEQFKPMFEGIKASTNRLLEEAGANLRFDFRPYNDGGVERQLGDLRYSFVVWHQDIDTTRGLLGYGPSSSDPRTGEVISANVHLYNVGMDWYRYLIQSYLEDQGALTAPEGGAWEETTCRRGTTAVPVASDNSFDTSGRLQSALFDEMRHVMDLQDGSGTAADFIPTPMKETFASDYHRLVNEFRYVEPAYNAYVYQEAFGSRLSDFAQRMADERQFSRVLQDVALNQNPFGAVALYGREGIQAQQEFLEDIRHWRKNHDLLKADRDMLFGRRSVYLFDPNDAISAIAQGARRCTNEGVWESNAAYAARIIEDVVGHVAIHEFGHNVGLRHNFYGSIDAKHMRPNAVSASVMDYVRSEMEVGHERGWGVYDESAIRWIYGVPAVRSEMMKEDTLYCTDEHRFRSPLCTAHDLGVTPSQIVLNAIERYDWMYKVRNSRAFRTFWDTSAYVGSVADGLFPLQRMWYMGIFDWGGGGVQNTLKRLDQLDPQREVQSNDAYDAIAEDFYNDMESSIGMTMAFYDSLINQSASFRNYQTEYDPFYGDILRMGIIIDKLFATVGFMDLQDVYNYDPNVQTYVSMYDAPFTDRNSAISKRVLDNMLGANYDTFPWFKYFALNIFASVTNTNLVDSLELKERIAIHRFNTQEAFEEVFGAEALAEALRSDNDSQLFIHNGEEYVYTYLPDRSWHLVAGLSRSPVSYQFMREYNEDLNASASITLDNYGLKILLAYHEYFNNFVGF